MNNEPKCIEFFDKLLFLINEKWRYKVAHGGRGSAKSWSFARGLIIKALEKNRRILCTREVQNSIKDSVHRLLSDQIEMMGYSKLFTITEHQIKCINGSAFIFEGLRSNIADIKSLEGIDICWVEEAQGVSKESWEVLTPTIRKNDSEIWVTFNPHNEDDETYQRFVVNTPPDAKVVQINWYDNPWFPESLRTEMEYCRKKDPLRYQHIWEGAPTGIGEKVYPMFDEVVHVRNFKLDYLFKYGNFFCAMDPHKVYYPFLLWGVKIPCGNDGFDYVIYNEFPSRGHMHGKFYHEIRHTVPCTLSLKQLADMIRVLDINILDRQYPVKILARGIDTRFAKGAGGRDWSANTEGVVVEWSRPENGALQWTLPEEKEIDAGMNIVKNLLFFQDGLPISALNDAHLFFMPHCQNIITTMKHHRNNLEKGIQDEKFKCASDTLRILMAVMTKTPYIDPTKSSETEVKLMGFREQLKPMFFGQTTNK